MTAQLYGLSGVNYDVRKQVFLARVSGEDKVAVVGPPSPLQDRCRHAEAGGPAGGVGGLRQGRQQLRFLRHHVLRARRSSARSSSATRAPAT